MSVLQIQDGKEEIIGYIILANIFLLYVLNCYFL